MPIRAWLTANSPTNSVTGCWEWQFGVNAYGYPRIKYRQKHYLAHRLMVDCPPGSIVRHLCHNRLCLNPQHLQVGTHAENVQDAVDAKRYIYGSDVQTSVLSEDDVRAIRSSSETYRELGMKYGVSKAQIGRIKRGEDWKWLK